LLVVGGQATIIGRGMNTSVFSATLLNESASHALDFDDVHIVMTGHPSVPVIPALILMDIRLPGGIDGLEATRRIKALPQLAHIPILAMTASVRPEDMQRALGEGCSGFVRKPIDIDELPRQVAEHIARASSTV